MCSKREFHPDKQSSGQEEMQGASWRSLSGVPATLSLIHPPISKIRTADISIFKRVIDSYSDLDFGEKAGIRYSQTSSGSHHCMLMIVDLC